MSTTSKAFATISSSESVTRRSLVAFGLLALALGYAVFQKSGLPVTDWNICLLFIALAAFVHWTGSISNPSSRTDRLLIVLLGYAAFQCLPLPIGILRFLSPERARILDTLAPLTPVRFAPLSVTRATTLLHLFRFIGYTLAFLSIRDLTRRWPAARKWLVMVPITGVAVSQAALGFWQRSTSQEVEGTYVNRNHFAGLLEMALPITLSFGIALLQRPANRRASGFRILAAVTLLISSGVIFAGLLDSLSKMGFVAGLAGLFAFAVLAICNSLQGWRRRLAMCGFIALIIFLFIFLPPDELVARFGGLTSPGEPAEGRWPIWRDTLHLIASYPVFGSGLGTYAVAFLKYQTSIVDRLFDFAHNDYLQLMSELGIIGCVLLAAVVVPVVENAFRTAGDRRDPDARWLAIGCAGSFTAIAIHSFADFNTYIPANALLLAWIGGVCAGLSPPSAFRSSRRLAFTLATLLAIFAPAWIVFESQFRSDSRAESVFCRFGICDTDAVVAAETLDRSGNASAIPPTERLRALRRDPNSPDRWCDAAESYLRVGQRSNAEYCLAQAVSLGPDIPPLLMRASDFYYALRQMLLALKLRARVLRETDTYDQLIFDWYGRKMLPASLVLAQGVPREPRAVRAYLRYLMALDQTQNAAAAWQWNTSYGYADDQLAVDYTNFLMRQENYKAAAQAWAGYLGSRRGNYLQSDWIFNGSFESELTNSPFDWRVEEREGVEVSRDNSVAHTGLHSLRIAFEGRENLNYSSVSQTAFVEPGKYHFQAFIKTDRITTDAGVGFRISSGAGSFPLNVTTARLTGTHNWTNVDQRFEIRGDTKLIRITVVREPSWKFDNKINGTVWIDSVSLTRERF